jgi:uncharacterized protein (TIGR00288 family)
VRETRCLFSLFLFFMCIDSACQHAFGHHLHAPLSKVPSKIKEKPIFPVGFDCSQKSPIPLINARHDVPIEASNMASTPSRIALFVDFENFFNNFGKDFKITPVMQKLVEHGVVSIRRAYGDWHKYDAYRRELVENGLELIDQPPLTSSGKNGADIKLATDAMEAVFMHPDIKIYAIASGDSDFIPLIRKLREHGRYVIVISSKVLAAPIMQRNCDEFIPCEIFGAGSPIEVDLNGAITLFKEVIRIREGKGDVLDIPQHKNMMLKLDPTFNERLFGHASFTEFIEAIITSQDLPYHVDRSSKSSVNYLVKNTS